MQPTPHARREGDVFVHFNTIEGVFSVLKRGKIGIYKHRGEAPLHRKLAEFDFRYNGRAATQDHRSRMPRPVVSMIEGKRLTYRRIGDADHG